MESLQDRDAEEQPGEETGEKEDGEVPLRRLHDGGEDHGVDHHQEQRVQHRPEQPENAALVADLQLAHDEHRHQRPVLQELP